MRFLLRVMCWEYHQLPSIESVLFPRVLFMASPQTRHLKFQRSKRSVAEERAGRKLGGLRVLNSYWINEDSTYKYYKYFHSSRLQQAALAHCTLHSPVSSGQREVNEAMKGLEFPNLDPVTKDSESK
nr:60S ribosomal protein L15-like [Ipomoea batatas]